MFLIQFICVLLFIPLVSHSLNIQFAVEYFKEFHPIQHLIIFTCGKSSDLVEIQKYIINEKLSGRVINSDIQYVPIRDALTRFNAAKCGVISDCECNSSSEILLEASNYRLYNYSYNWLIIDDLNIGLNELLNPLKGIQMNSQITFVSPRIQLKGYELIDIYSHGRHLEFPIINKTFAYWLSTKGFTIVHKFPVPYHTSYRGNFHGKHLRGATVIDRDNVNASQAETYLSEPGVTPGIAVFVKYHFYLTLLLKDIYNFTLKYRVTRAWAGRIRGGYRVGIIGVGQRNEADILVTGIFTRINRHDEFDWLHGSYIFDPAFLFRITSDLSASSSSGNFLTPFAPDVWLYAGGLLALLIVIRCVFIYIRIKKRLAREPDMTISGCIIDALASSFQQGIDPLPVYPSTRILLYVFMICTMLVYNFYTSSVVGDILSNPIKGPETLEDLISSPLILSFQDIGYHKVLFHETQVPVIRKLYQKKVLSPRSSNDIPVYTDIKTAVGFLKRGGYAFHSEVIDTYPEIAKKFDIDEICDLRRVDKLFQKQLIYGVVTKNSMYTEMLRISLMRIQECGFVNRLQRIFIVRKPECQSSAVVHPVALGSIARTFYVLFVGMLLSLIVLGMELLYKREKSRITRNLLKRQQHKRNKRT